MADLFESFKQAFGKKAEKSIDDPSNVVVDHPEQGIVVLPADVAQRAGYPALLKIKPSQVPKDESKRLTMTALYRKRLAERMAREKEQEDTRAKADAELAERNKPFLERQAARAAASERSVSLPPGIQRSLDGVAAVTAGPPATIRPAAPPPAPEPEIEVSPVGRTEAPALPRALPPPVAPAPMRQTAPSTPPQSLADIPAPVLKAFAQQRMPDETPSVTAPVALPMAIPPPQVRPPAVEEEAPIRAAPTPFAMPPTTEGPKARPAQDFAALSPPAPVPAPQPTPEWEGFQSPAPRVTEADHAALLVMAGGRVGQPLRAPVGAADGDVMGSLTTRMPMPAETGPSMDERDAAALKALARAQRADEISSGIGALGDVFGQARDLILNRPLQQLRQRGSTAVQNEQARQELIAAQEKMRRDNRLADATVASKERDATKDAAAMEAAKAKAAKAERDAATLAALNDPASEESARIRETVTQLLGQRVDASTLEKLSGAELKDIALKYGVSLTNAEQSAGLRALQIQQSGEDTDYANSLRAQSLAMQEQELELARDRLAQQQEQFDKSLAEKEQARTDAREDKTQAHAEKMAQLNVGGFKFDSKNPPSIEGAKKMADVAVARDEVLGSLSRLEALYSKHGPTMIGEVAGQMETEWMNVTNRLRTLNEMGVPNGADYLMLSKQIQDPTGARAQVTSAARAKAQFAQLRDQVRRKVDATAKAYKYEPASGRTTPSAALPTGADGNPMLETGRARPVLPPVSPSSSGVKTVSIRGMRPGDLKASLAEGESVRYPIGGGQYQVVQRKDDKLVKVRVE